MTDATRALPASDEAVGLPPPRALALELTKGCNLRCAYCYYADREDAYDPRTRMAPEVAERSVELLLEEGPSAEPVHLHFFGGEPLLDFPLLRRTVLYGERRAAEVGRSITFEVTTNGTRLTDEVVAFLNEHRVHVGVSFDGPPEVQDAARPAARGSSYAMALPGIRRLLETRRGTPLAAKTHCSVVVTRLCSDLVALTRHLTQLGFEKIILTPATDLEGRSSGFRDEDLPGLLAAYDALADAYEADLAAGRPVAETWFPGLMRRLLSGERRQHFCQGGRDYLGVAADGKLALCYRFFEDEEFGMGSVQTGVDRGVTRRLGENPVDARTTCSACWARYFCGGGCHHDNLTTTGDVAEPNPVACDVFRHTMGRTLDAWARLTRKGLLERRASVPSTSMGGKEERGPFGGQERPRAAPGCHVRDLDGEKVVYEPRTHEVSVLNATAAFIFELCDGEHSVAEILALLAERFDAPGEVLRRDLEETLQHLHAKELLA